MKEETASALRICERTWDGLIENEYGVETASVGPENYSETIRDPETQEWLGEIELKEDGRTAEGS